MPVVTTLHTVLANPTPAQHNVMSEIINASAKIVVMAEKGHELLRSVHNVPARKIEIIAHGIPDFPFLEPHHAKAKLGLTGKTILTFGLLSPKFFTAANLSNLLVQASSTAVVGVGMTFVLLTAGVDLSVGSIMFVAAAVAGKLALGGASLPVTLAAIVGVGLVFGMLNALLVTRLGILAFIATLGTLYAGRGFGLWLTQTRAMNLPDSFLTLGTARLAGILYFFLAITGAFNLEYVPSQIVVQGDPAATCQNILNKEFLFRIGIASDVISNVLYIFLVLMFYQLFKNVNERLAKLLVALVLVQIPIAFVLATFNITSLLILKGEVLKSLDTQKAQDLAILFRRLRGNGISLEEIFWGLWLFPLGLLAYQSRFIPRIIGVLVIITGFAYIIESLTFILFPDYQDLADKYMFPLFFGELSIIFWLLIKGVKSKIVA
jgi:hypothetical protein